MPSSLDGVNIIAVHIMCQNWLALFRFAIRDSFQSKDFCWKSIKPNTVAVTSGVRLTELNCIHFFKKSGFGLFSLLPVDIDSSVKLCLWDVCFVLFYVCFVRLCQDNPPQQSKC